MNVARTKSKEKGLAPIVSQTATGQIIIVSSSEVENGSAKPKLGFFENLVDGFRRADAVEMGLSPNMTEQQRIAVMTARSPLQRSLKNRHLQMIAIGGAIGTGLFVGSGSALHQGGPAGFLIAYILMGTMIFCTVQSMAELSITFPVAGAFLTYNSRFIDPSWGFAMAWNYFMQWFVVLPLELVAASLTILNWKGARSISPAAFVAVFFVAIVFINLFGVKGYGEAEFVFSMIKVLAVIGFIFLGVILVCGGGPVGGYIGAKYWYDPGAFNNGFKGTCSVFVSAAFAFAGTELCGLAATEASNPRKSVPKATKQVFWRIALFYITSLTLIGLLVPSNDKRLLGSSSVDLQASPFVIAIKNGGIKGLPSVMNAVVLISVVSVANSAVFASSRILAAIAVSGHAPRIFGYIDKRGRPIVGAALQLVFGILSFIAVSPKEADVFNWLLAVSGLCSLFTWFSINLSFLRFREALKAQGRSTEELWYTSLVGVYGATYGCGLNVLCLVAQFWIAVFPIGAKPSATSFFSAYLSALIVPLFYLGHKLWTRNWSLYISADYIDIDTGRRELNLALLKQEIAEERAYKASLPFYHRVYNFWC